MDGGRAERFIAATAATKPRAFASTAKILTPKPVSYTHLDVYKRQVQLEAYAQALADMGIRVQRKRILHLKKDGIYSIRDYPANDVNRWRVFGALKTVYDYIESSK